MLRIDEGISQGLYYSWSKEFLEVGKKRLAGDTTREANTDEGPGLTDADRARAFSPFTRLSARTGEGAPSTGLGLWIGRLIAKRHGGRIEAENRPDGKGAVFSLYLPAKQGTPSRRISS